MIPELQSRFRNKRADILFIFGIFLFQLLFIFQGLDFADQGVYATNYQQIFNKPESVQFLFIYWLSAIAGGMWIKLFPGLGLLGIRIAGVLVTTTTIILVYFALKKYISTFSLRTGLLITVIILSCQTPSELHYDNLSILLWVTGSLFIFHGLNSNKLLYLFLAGFIVGLNIFTRLPNILGIAIVISVFYYGWLNGITIKKQVYNGAVFFIGLITAISFVLLIMALIGHLKLFLDSLHTVMVMGASQEDDHNLLMMTKKLVLQFSDSISLAGIFLIGILFYFAISQVIESKIKFYIYRIFLLFIISFFLLMIKAGIFSWTRLEFFVIGITFLANVYILLDKRSLYGLKLMSFLGLVMLFVFPVGSAGVFFNAGRFALWFSVPLGIEVIQKFRNLNISFSFSTQRSKPIVIGQDQMSVFPKLFIYPVILAGLFFAFTSPYFDRSSRLGMFYSIPNRHLKGIFTTKARANVVSELLTASNHYVKTGDYVLAFDNIPMYYYLTETIPYISNPCPGMYPSELFRNDLKKSLQRDNRLPIVVFQKVKTIDSNWPENVDELYSESKRNDKRTQYFNEFLIDHGYTVLWENIAFVIMKPGI